MVIFDALGPTPGGGGGAFDLSRWKVDGRGLAAAQTLSNVPTRKARQAGDTPGAGSRNLPPFATQKEDAERSEAGGSYNHAPIVPTNWQVAQSEHRNERAVPNVTSRSSVP